MFAGEFHIGNVRISVTVLWWIFFVAVASFVLFRTKLGGWITAVGGNADAARASRRNRARSPLRSARKTFTATTRPSRRSRARYTSPIPPAPSGATIS